MKTGAPKSLIRLFVGFNLALLSIPAMPGCGKSSPPQAAAAAAPAIPPPSASAADGQSALKGYAAFGSQCASGFNTDPKVIKLELWSCPLNLPIVELAEPIQPLYFSADCARKQLTIRSYDKSIDVSWELMPDGSFNITQEGLRAKLKADGSGNSNCTTTLSMDAWGKVDCAAVGSDKAKISLEFVMWLNKQAGPSPGVAAPAPPNGPQCALPTAKCYFHAITSVDQCN